MIYYLWVLSFHFISLLFHLLFSSLFAQRVHPLMPPRRRPTEVKCSGFTAAETLPMPTYLLLSWALKLFSHLFFSICRIRFPILLSLSPFSFTRALMCTKKRGWMVWVCWEKCFVFYFYFSSLFRTNTLLPKAARCNYLRLLFILITFLLFFTNRVSATAAGLLKSFPFLFLSCVYHRCEQKGEKLNLLG